MPSTHSTFPTYETYSDSGVEWLGEIPTGWKTKRIKFTAKTNPSGDKSLKDEIVTFLPMEAVSSQGDYETSKINKRSSFSDSLTEFKKNDIILAKITPCFENGKSAYLNFLPTEKGVGSTEFHVLRPYTQLLNPKYLYYCLANSGYRNFAEPFMEGTAGQKRLTTPFLKNSIISFPDLHIQNKIVKFLDQKTAAIDKAIAKKQRLIELLKEQKAILINRAVTRGLNPDIPMKDSGVEWIGEIPAHWELKKLKKLCSFQGGSTPSKDNASYWNGELPWVSPKDMKSFYISSSIDKITEKALHKTGLQLISEKALLVVVRGMILVRKIPVGITKKPVTINQDMKALIFDEKICSPEFIAYSIIGKADDMSSLLEESGHGTKTLPTPNLQNFIFALPNLHEQTEIVKFIQDIEHKIDSMKNMEFVCIQKLQEYKQTLIAHAVTGKIKIG